MIQKSMTRKPFLEFSHTEAKKPWHISLCCCMSTKQHKLDRVWEVYQNSSNNLVTEWYKFSQEILLSFYTVICFLKAKHMACWLDTFQDFLIKLGIKPPTYLLEINIFTYTKSCHCQTYQNYEHSWQKLGTILKNKVS